MIPCLQVWKQKAQYLQHKQIKAEATTVKQKTSPSEASPIPNKIKSKMLICIVFPHKLFSVVLYQKQDRTFKFCI